MSYPKLILKAQQSLEIDVNSIVCFDIDLDSADELIVATTGRNKGLFIYKTDPLGFKFSLKYRLLTGSSHPEIITIATQYDPNLDKFYLILVFNNGEIGLLPIDGNLTKKLREGKNIASALIVDYFGVVNGREIIVNRPSLKNPPCFIIYSSSLIKTFILKDNQIKEIEFKEMPNLSSTTIINVFFADVNGDSIDEIVFTTNNGGLFIYGMKDNYFEEIPTNVQLVDYPLGGYSYFHGNDSFHGCALGPSPTNDNSGWSVYRFENNNLEKIDEIDKNILPHDVIQCLTNDIDEDNENEFLILSETKLLVLKHDKEQNAINIVYQNSFNNMSGFVTGYFGIKRHLGMVVYKKNYQQLVLSHYLIIHKNNDQKIVDDFNDWGKSFLREKFIGLEKAYQESSPSTSRNLRELKKLENNLVDFHRSIVGIVKIKKSITTVDETLVNELRIKAKGMAGWIKEVMARRAVVSKSIELMKRENPSVKLLKNVNTLSLSESNNIIVKIKNQSDTILKINKIVANSPEIEVVTDKSLTIPEKSRQEVTDLPIKVILPTKTINNLVDKNKDSLKVDFTITFENIYNNALSVDCRFKQNIKIEKGLQIVGLTFMNENDLREGHDTTLTITIKPLTDLYGKNLIVTFSNDGYFERITTYDNSDDWQSRQLIKDHEYNLIFGFRIIKASKNACIKDIIINYNDKKNNFQFRQMASKTVITRPKPPALQAYTDKERIIESLTEDMIVDIPLTIVNIGEGRAYNLELNPQWNTEYFEFDPLKQKAVSHVNELKPNQQITVNLQLKPKKDGTNISLGKIILLYQDKFRLSHDSFDISLPTVTINRITPDLMEWLESAVMKNAKREQRFDLFPGSHQFFLHVINKGKGVAYITDCNVSFNNKTILSVTIAGGMRLNKKGSRRSFPLNITVKNDITKGEITGTIKYKDYFKDKEYSLKIGPYQIIIPTSETDISGTTYLASVEKEIIETLTKKGYITDEEIINNYKVNSEEFNSIIIKNRIALIVIKSRKTTIYYTQDFIFGKLDNYVGKIGSINVKSLSNKFQADNSSVFDNVIVEYLCHRLEKAQQEL